MASIFHPEREQSLVQEFFAGKAGIFVDVGANDPVVNSQTYHLECLGWDGVLIEPLPQYADRLAAERSAPLYRTACGNPAQHGSKLPITVAGVHSSMCNTAPSLTTIEVPVRTLASIVEEAGLTQIDFLSLDVEGFELEVLAGIPLHQWQPRLILMEDHVLDLARHRYLVTRGYKLVRRTGVNAWYVPEKTIFLVDLHGRWQLFRKYVIGLPFRKLRAALRNSASNTIPWVFVAPGLIDQLQALALA
jgi:FkbM family methyltransferase